MTYCQRSRKYGQAPGFGHAAEHAGVFGAAHALVGEHLRIVAADVLHDAERLARSAVHQLEAGALGDLAAQLVHQVAGVRDVFGGLEFSAAGLPEVLADLRLQLGELPPGLQDLGVVAEGGDAGGHEVLVARLGHQRELARHDGHRRLLRDGVAMIGDARAGGVVLGFVDVATEQVAADREEIFLGSREEILPDAAPDIEPVVVRNLFLVVRPDLLFALVNHFFSVIAVLSSVIPDLIANLIRY